MQTDDLIAHLSTSLTPVAKGTVRRQLLLAAALGMSASAVLMIFYLGPRHDFGTAITSFGMWMKLAYTFSLATLALWLVDRAGRPGADTTRPLALLALPLAAIALLAGLQLAQSGTDMERMILGSSSRVCATNIALIALPVLVASFLVLRRMAPTHLTLAGAGAGLFAGAAGAFVYSFHCQEATAPFVAIWYTLGIALTTGIAALLGPRLLRW